LQVDTFLKIPDWGRPAAWPGTPEASAGRQTALALLRLIVWLTILSYVQDLRPGARLVFTIVWISAFLWRYAYSAWSEPPAARGSKTRLGQELPLSLPKHLIPHIAILALLVACSLPWSGAFFTGGCANPGWYESVWKERALSAQHSGYFIALSLLADTATFPLVEEFTFRGWLLVAWTRKLGPAWAVILTSAVFAVGHFTPSPGLLVSHFVFGLLLALAVLGTNSLWSAFAMHYAYNFANDVMTIYPVHGFFANLFRMRVFRCDTSGLMVALSVALMLAIILAARRANTDDSKAVLRKVDA